MKKELVSIIILALLIATALTVHGAVSDTKQMDPQPEIILVDIELDQWQDTDDNTGWGCWETDGEEAIAQQFVPTLNTLTRVDLKIFSRGSPPGLKISIRDSLDGADLTFVESSPEYSDGHGFRETFQLPEINLIPWETYYIVWKPIGTHNDGSCWYWLFGDGDRYDAGEPWIKVYGEWMEMAAWYKTIDFCFRTYGYDRPVAYITSPTDGAYVSETVTITGTANNPSGNVQSVDIKIDSGFWEHAEGTNSWTYEWDTLAFEDGIHTISVRCEDSGEFGYSYTTSVDVNVINPVISIDEINGGKLVNATITNTGTATATNVVWTIDLSGGLIFSGGHATGVISELPVGTSETVELLSLFGIGKTTITVTAYGVTKQASGFMLGPWVLGLE